MDFKAVLFDTRSIQQYIFSGNKLKTNIGASYLVEKLFSDALINAVKQVCGQDSIDTTTWEKDASPNWQQMEKECSVGYIGGGNALLLFRPETNEQTLRDVVSTFTKVALVKYPGLRTGAAIGVIAMDEAGNFILDDEGKSGLDHLHESLKNEQNTVFPEVSLPYTGLTHSCISNGETANAYDASDERFYSWEVETKIQAASKKNEEESPAEKELMEKLRSVVHEEDSQYFLQGWEFPRKFDELGQKETEDYYAIVHIDGNNMGKQFRKCKTLAERKNLSRSIRQTTIKAFYTLLEDIMHEYDSYKFLNLKIRSDGKRVLPIRPLILGGDDMTFVCHAKLAVRFAQLVMKELKQFDIYTCGGIAILPTAYPFFRGYTMTEQLCGAAKKRMRQDGMKAAEDDIGSCWLDFAILHGEQSPTLAQIREQEYRGVLGNMHFGPYRVDADPTLPESLDNLLQAVEYVRYGEHKLPMSKIKEMRRVIAESRHKQIQFMQQLEYLRRNNPDSKMRFPDIAAWKNYEKELWCDKRTPYVDMIELIDFYEPKRGAK